MYINVSAKNEKELQMRITDNESRGWTLVKKGAQEDYHRDWQYSEHDLNYKFQGVSSYKKHIAVMFREDK